MKRTTEPAPKDRTPRRPSATPSGLATGAESSTVLIGRAPGEVPAELRSAAARALQTILPGAAGPVDISSQSSPARTVGDKAWVDDLLAPMLQGAGYRRVDRLTYLADFSTADVEHTLAFDASGKSMNLISGDAALSNAPAAAFAQQCVQRYGDPAQMDALKKSGYVVSPWFRPMRFSIGMLFRWGRLCALDTTRMSRDEPARITADAIAAKLIPYVESITTKARLLEFLERDEEPMRWFRVRALFRAAMIAHLARTLRIPREQTRAALSARATAIAPELRNTSLSPPAFVDHVINDAEVLES